MFSGVTLGAILEEACLKKGDIFSAHHPILCEVKKGF
jgi:hypothetical protein